MDTSGDFESRPNDPECPHCGHYNGFRAGRYTCEACNQTVSFDASDANPLKLFIRHPVRSIAAGIALAMFVVLMGLAVDGFIGGDGR